MGLINLDLGTWAIFWLFFGVGVIAIVVLTVVERRIHKKTEARKEEYSSSLQGQIDRIEKMADSPENVAGALERVSLNFFGERYPSAKANDLQDFAFYFSDKGDYEKMEFCNSLQFLLYSGGKTENRKVNSLIKTFKKIAGTKERNRQTEVKPGVIEKLEKMEKHFEDEIREPVHRFTMELDKISKEPPAYEYIKSFDDLERVKKKIFTKRRGIKLRHLW